MIAKAKVISHGANAIRYSVDKDKAEIVKTNLLPDDISPTAMWARMLALQKKFEDKLNRYHPLKRNMIRIEVSPTSEETQGWTMEEWQRLADDFIREFDAVDLSAKSKRKSAKATNLVEPAAGHHFCDSDFLHRGVPDLLPVRSELRPGRFRILRAALRYYSECEHLHPE